MSKLACRCGYIISNVQYPSPHESRVVPESAIETIITEVGGAVGELIALKEEDRREWLVQRFGEQYPADATNAEIVEDIFGPSLHDHSLSMATCPACGCLHLQSEPDVNSYRVYAPSTYKKSEAG